MGLYDTIVLDRRRHCRKCGAEIKDVQVKEFESALLTYRLGDCVSDPDDIRIFKASLFCGKCEEFTGEHIYVSVNRGILVGTLDNLEEAKGLIGSLSLDKLLLMYHSLHKTHSRCHAARKGTLRLLADLYGWYKEETYKKAENDPDRKLFFSKGHFVGIDEPLEALRQLVAYEKMLFVLDELQENAQAVLEIHYTEDVKEGEEVWSTDVRQDEINERCGTERAWTLISKKQLDLDPEKKGKRHPDCVIVVDKPFSRQTVVDSLERWLYDRGYTFTVELVEPGQAEKTGTKEKSE